MMVRVRGAMEPMNIAHDVFVDEAPGVEALEVDHWHLNTIP